MWGRRVHPLPLGLQTKTTIRSHNSGSPPLCRLCYTPRNKHNCKYANRGELVKPRNRHRLISHVWTRLKCASDTSAEWNAIIWNYVGPPQSVVHAVATSAGIDLSTNLYNTRQRTASAKSNPYALSIDSPPSL